MFIFVVVAYLWTVMYMLVVSGHLYLYMLIYSCVYPANADTESMRMRMIAERESQFCIYLYNKYYSNGVWNVAGFSTALLSSNVITLICVAQYAQSRYKVLGLLWSMQTRCRLFKYCTQVLYCTQSDAISIRIIYLHTKYDFDFAYTDCTV